MSRSLVCVMPFLHERVGGTPQPLNVCGGAQNGSDVRGVALPGIPNQDVTLTPVRCVE